MQMCPARAFSLRQVYTQKVVHTGDVLEKKKKKNMSLALGTEAVDRRINRPSEWVWELGGQLQLLPPAVPTKISPSRAVSLQSLFEPPSPGLFSLLLASWVLSWTSVFLNWPEPARSLEPSAVRSIQWALTKIFGESLNWSYPDIHVSWAAFNLIADAKVNSTGFLPNKHWGPALCCSRVKISEIDALLAKRL